ncbi:hypothetical protein ACHAW6_008208 [Cyclotella cf. meneghiniana]
MSDSSPMNSSKNNSTNMGITKVSSSLALETRLASRLVHLSGRQLWGKVCWQRTCSSFTIHY